MKMQMEIKSMNGTPAEMQAVIVFEATNEQMASALSAFILRLEQEKRQDEAKRAKEEGRV